MVEAACWQAANSRSEGEASRRPRWIEGAKLKPPFAATIEAPAMRATAVVVKETILID